MTRYNVHLSEVRGADIAVILPDGIDRANAYRLIRAGEVVP